MPQPEVVTVHEKFTKMVAYEETQFEHSMVIGWRTFDKTSFMLGYTFACIDFNYFLEEGDYKEAVFLLGLAQMLAANFTEGDCE